MMIRILLPLLLLAVCTGGCHRDDNNNNGSGCDTVRTAAPAAEGTTLQQYITTNSISATADSRGFYYSIVTAGTGSHPTVCSNVTVNYVGRLTNGVQFDAASKVSFDLSGLITGWQEGIPLIGAGGRIILYLPPSLAYGAQAQGSIPANSILIFTIDLVSVN